MNKLYLKYKDIEFINPFILASSPVSKDAGMIMRAFEAGWGGAVTKTICLDSETIKNASPRLQEYRVNNNILGLNNIELISDRSCEEWLEDIRKIKSEFPDRVLIASIMAEAYNLSGWQKLTKLVQQAGADIIELNVSCPHGMPERGMGGFCSEIPEVCINIVKAVKAVSTISVWTKLSPNITDISYLAQVCLEAGSDGIVAINTVKGFSGIDIETLKPKLNINGDSTYGGFSGKLIKPFALKAVSDIAITNNNCYISATGGISSWQDAVEFMLLGASNVQICTEVMFNGYEIINDLVSGMQTYLDRHNYSSISELIGLSLNSIKHFNELNKTILPKACIDEDRCLKCGRCYHSCNDGGCQAIERSTDASFVVNQNKCTGCGLCSMVCPKKCISLKPVSSKVS